MTTDLVLEEARAKALAKISTRLQHASVNDIVRLDQEYQRTAGPFWRPERPDRRMPTLWQLACYWRERGTFGEVRDIPHCFGCGKIMAGFSSGPTPAIRWNQVLGPMERAHLATRSKGGLDGPQNIVPLCFPCHDVMPWFEAHEGAEAIHWVQNGGRWQGIDD